MQIDLTDIINVQGEQVEFDGLVDITPVDDELKFEKPAHVVGMVKNIGSTLEFTANISVTYTAKCDRCVRQVEGELEFKVFEILRKIESDDNIQDDDTYYFKGNVFDPGNLIVNEIFMNKPAKFLCREDCKGLCPYCGSDLNITECDCKDKMTDPRFDILNKF